MTLATARTLDGRKASYIREANNRNNSNNKEAINSPNARHTNKPLAELIRNSNRKGTK